MQSSANASTIRGDPKKFVGILHNPLYRGTIIWGRRDWRKGSGLRPLSGLIKCGCCGSNYTIVGKDYYRCARNRDSGTCDNSRPVKVSSVEEAALEVELENLSRNVLAGVMSRTLANMLA